MRPFVRDPDEMPEFLPPRLSSLGSRKITRTAALVAVAALLAHSVAYVPAGIAGFQKIVSQGISQQLLTWKGIEATEKLAASKNSKVLVIGSGSTGLPLILGSQ
jgi:regulator of protease activity HflC (stomatin/prohibitin superfamily)